MKGNIIITFAIICIIFYTVIDVKVANTTAISTKKIEYTKALESSVDDALESIVELDDNLEFKLYKEQLVEQFYKSLYSNFGIMDDKDIQSQFNIYTPILMITDIDGVYFYYTDIHYDGVDKLLIKKWSDKIPFVYSDSNYVYTFHLDETMKIFTKSNKEVYEGTYEELKVALPGIFINVEDYEQLKKDTINNIIIENMNYYIEHHNLIGNQYGIEYDFWIPNNNENDLYNTITERSLLVTFQGYPYDIEGQFFNYYTFVGASVTKSRNYYLQEVDGIMYYHKDNCSHLTDYSFMVKTPIDGALEGAFPCVDCVY